MNIKEAFQALEGLENGKEIVEALQSELKTIRDESAKRRIEKKEVLEALGLTDNAKKDELAEIKNMIATIKNNGSDPLVLSKKLEELSNQVADLTAKNEAAEKAKLDEFNKRVNQAKLSKAVEVLSANNANNPSTISKLILDNLVYDQEKETINYVSQGNTLSVEDGVKAFLADNPYLIKNTQNSGSGNSVNSSGQTHKVYTADDIRQMTPEQINANWGDIQNSLKD